MPRHTAAQQTLSFSGRSCEGFSVSVVCLVLSGTKPHLPLLFSTDEMKDEFDAMGPDATLQTVGNGTGEFSPLEGDVALEATLGQSCVGGCVSL